MRSPRANRGVALVTALLIVALASVAAASLATQQQLDVRRTGNLIDGDQAWAYAIGAEDWAKLILRRDQAKTQFDALTEVWAKNLPPIDLPGGYMLGKISDAQARININNLITNNPQNSETYQRLERLLNLLELDPGLAQAVVDWVDPDINPLTPDGAEDDYYASLDRPYRTPNTMMASVSELRLVKGFTEKVYQRVAPFVTALPNATAINVNTAPAEVLATLADNLDPKAAISLIEVRQENPFKTIPEFTASMQRVAGIDQASVNDTSLDVKSQYFNVTVETRIGYGRALLSSLLLRGGQGDIQVIRRAQGID